jgi:hypothetical protein
MLAGLPVALIAFTGSAFSPVVVDRGRSGR